MLLRLVRWWLTLLGGALLGAGLVLHGQVACALYLRHQVEDTFFLWRAIGRLTFVFQGDVTRLALTLSDLPPEALAESDRAAWVLVVLGGLLALAAPLARRPGRS